MVRTRIALAGLVVLLGVIVTGSAAQARAGHELTRSRQVVGYFIQWGIYGRSYFVKNVETQRFCRPVDGPELRLRQRRARCERRRRLPER